MGESEAQRPPVAAGEAGERTARSRLPRPLRRLLRVAAGRKKRRRRSEPRTADDHAIAWLWPYLTLTIGKRYPPLYENRDAMILQMGRVGSISIYEAMRREYNAYHTHGFSDPHCAGTLQRLQKHDLDRHAMGSHVAAVAHSALLDWYKLHKRRNGSRLRIVTLTRDPASWMSSHLILRRFVMLPHIRSWRAAAGLGSGEPADDLAAMRDFGAALGELILAARPSRGMDAAVAEIGRLARLRWPTAPEFERVAGSATFCARWFDREVKPVLGLDLLADPRLRDGGAVRTETDYAEILLLRFEDLPASAPLFRDFLGLGTFTLPHSNATGRSEDGAALRAAFEAGIEQAGGAAVRRELRASEYGRAAGYDRLTD